MSGAVKRMLFVVGGMMVSFSANAFDLNGAWTTDASNCAKVFVTKNNRLSMTRNSDVYGGGFIVQGNDLRGQARTCKITSRKEEDGVLNLIAMCSTEIAVLGTQQLSVRIDGDDRLTRIVLRFLKWQSRTIAVSFDQLPPSDEFVGYWPLADMR
jgi:hypothetical protein